MYSDNIEHKDVTNRFIDMQELKKLEVKKFGYHSNVYRIDTSKYYLKVLKEHKICPTREYGVSRGLEDPPNFKRHGVKTLDPTIDEISFFDEKLPLSDEDNYCFLQYVVKFSPECYETMVFIDSPLDSDLILNYLELHKIQDSMRKSGLNVLDLPIRNVKESMGYSFNFLVDCLVKVMIFDEIESIELDGFKFLSYEDGFIYLKAENVSMLPGNFEPVQDCFITPHGIHIYGPLVDTLKLQCDLDYDVFKYLANHGRDLSVFDYLNIVSNLIKNSEKTSFNIKVEVSDLPYIKETNYEMYRAIMFYTRGKQPTCDLYVTPILNDVVSRYYNVSEKELCNLEIDLSVFVRRYTYLFSNPQDVNFIKNKKFWG